MDSEASSHKVRRIDLIDYVKPADVTEITILDSRNLESSERGSTRFSSKRSNGITSLILLSNILSVPGIDSNLLSCTELARDGYIVTFPE